MKILLVTITIVLTYTCAIAQDTTGLKRLVARFEVPRESGGPEYGTGFIIARQGDTLYLATAGHVLRDHAPGAPVIVTLGDVTDTLHATIRLYQDPEKDGKEDLAICSVLLKGYEYPKVKPLDTLRAGVPVFYYRNRHLNAETGDSDQLLITWNNTTHTYQVYMPGVEGGDSGGPVFTYGPTPGLSGIIISGDQSCEVLRISRILTILKKELPSLTFN